MAHRPNIFREVKEYRQIILTRLKDNVYSDEFDLEQKRLDALDEILRFLRSLSWIKQKGTKERLEYYLKESGLNARTTAAAFDIENLNAVEQTIKYASDKIKPIMDVPLSQIWQANDGLSIESALVDFRKAVKQELPYGYFLSGIIQFLPEPKYNPKYNLGDCCKELSRIGVFAHYAKYVLTQECDQSKLAHILSLLNSYNGSADDREALKLFFSGEFSTSETGESRKITDQVNQLLQWLYEKNPFYQ